MFTLKQVTHGNSWQRNIYKAYLVSVLAYHILHTVRYQLMKHGINDNWQTISSKLSTHYRITNSLQRKDESPIHIRKSTRANPTQLAIYNACNIPSTILKSNITSY